MTDSAPATVAVPVELLRALVEDEPRISNLRAAKALLPKQEPAIEMTAAMLERELEQDQRVQAWHRIWAHVKSTAPMAVEDNRTATDYVLSLLPELPKPTPRLVAVDLDDLSLYANDGVHISGVRLSRQPDLLTLLDDAVDKWFDSGEGYRDELKSRIRNALGVNG
jgi:hypothetical protein